MRIYDQALSADDVSRLYRIEATPRPGSPRAEAHSAIYVEASDLTVGYSYQLQVSTDNGRKWEDSGDPFVAVTKKMVVAHFNGDDADRLDFRVRQVP